MDPEGEEHDATDRVTPILEARGLVKRYGHVTALGGSDFDLRPGEILAVIGDNGAGKSSLIKCLSGAVVPDEGEILLDGKPIHMRTPIDARALRDRDRLPDARGLARRSTSPTTCSSAASRARRASSARSSASSTAPRCAPRPRSR